jgi:mannose-6-phosphate isomerase-like protein (cupin superfamily)
MLAALDRYSPVEIASPFEESESVAGAVWWRGNCDGALKLRFMAGASDLPMHAHEWSDRIIVVLAGEGRFHFSEEPLRRFCGDNIRSRLVRPFDVLYFVRGVVHTFSTRNSELVLFSYHRPFFPLEEPEQYTIPEVLCFPGREIRDSAPSYCQSPQVSA